jgi:hypothetical protein
MVRKYITCKKYASVIAKAHKFRPVNTLSYTLIFRDRTWNESVIR